MQKIKSLFFLKNILLPLLALPCSRHYFIKNKFRFPADFPENILLATFASFRLLKCFTFFYFRYLFLCSSSQFVSNSKYHWAFYLQLCFRLTTSSADQLEQLSYYKNNFTGLPPIVRPCLNVCWTAQPHVLPSELYVRTASASNYAST